MDALSVQHLTIERNLFIGTLYLLTEPLCLLYGSLGRGDRLRLGIPHPPWRLRRSIHTIILCYCLHIFRFCGQLVSLPPSPPPLSLV
jgi:hypothetical protein